MGHIGDGNQVRRSLYADVLSLGQGVGRRATAR